MLSPLAGNLSPLGVTKRFGFTFLLRDDFLIDDPAPVISPRACEPGPGTMIYVQVAGNGQFSISNEYLNFPTGNIANLNNSGAYNLTPFARVPGLAIVAGDDILNLASNNQHVPAMWKATQATVNPTAAGGARWGLVAQNSTSTWNVISNLGAAITMWPSSSISYNIIISLRETGYFIYMKGGIFSSWAHFWVGASGTTTPVYAALSPSQGSAARLGTYRIVQLPYPFDNENGVVTQAYTGVVEFGQSFTHESDCVLSYTVTTLPSSGSIKLEFRELNASNKWYIDVASGGTVTLFEVVSGAATSRGTSTIAAGQSINAYMIGSRIRVVCNETTIISYDSASNFSTTTTGVLQDLGTGGVISNLYVRPMYLPSNAQHTLDQTLL